MFMSLKGNMLSGVLCISILFSCGCVKAEDEVETISRKIDSSFSVMSLNTHAAWDIYIKLVEIYKIDLSNSTKIYKFYTVLLKLERSLKQMPVTDTNLMEAISALNLCYQAYRHQHNTNYLKAYKKLKKAHEKYRTLIDKVKDTQDTHMFEFMVFFCELFEDICVKKISCYNEFYKKYLKGIFRNLNGMQIDLDANSEKISYLEKYVIYQLLEPLRGLIVNQKTMTSDVFDEQLNERIVLMREVVELFEDRCKKSPEFRRKLQTEMNKILKYASCLKKSSKDKGELLHDKVSQITFLFYKN